MHISTLVCRTVRGFEETEDATRSRHFWSHKPNLVHNVLNVTDRVNQPIIASQAATVQVFVHGVCKLKKRVAFGVVWKIDGIVNHCSFGEVLDCAEPFDVSICTGISLVPRDAAPGRGQGTELCSSELQHSCMATHTEGL